MGVASPKLSLVKRCPDVDVAKPADPESRSAQQRRLRPRRQPKSAPRGGSVADPPPLATPSGALDTVRAGGATPGGTHAPPAPGTSVPPCEIPNAPANDRLQALALSPDVLAQQDAAEFLEAGWGIVERSEDRFPLVDVEPEDPRLVLECRREPVGRGAAVQLGCDPGDELAGNRDSCDRDCGGGNWRQGFDRGTAFSCPRGPRRGAPPLSSVGPRARHEDHPLTARGSTHRRGGPGARDGAATVGQPLRVHHDPEGAGARRAGAVRCRDFRRREWGPAIDAAAITKPARLYDLRSTFASNALAAGITMFELARIMGTSAKMIEQHYGTLIDTAHDAILTRLDSVG